MVLNYAGLYKSTWDPNLKDQDAKDLWNKSRAILDKNIQTFPKNCLYMRWNYNAPKVMGDQLAIDWFNEHKLSTMAATAAQTNTPMLPLNNSNFQPIKDFCQLTSEKKMSGILCTIWDDTSPHFETVWRGIYDFALFSWNYEDVSKETAHAIFRHRFYTPEMASASFDFEDSLEKGINFWSRAFLSEGNRYKYHDSFKLIDLPEANKTKDWIVKYKDKISFAENAVSQYKQINSELSNAMALARRNAYSLEVFNQINELEAYSSNLLLLLRQYDIAPLQGKKEPGLVIKKFINDFAGLRMQFETVYSQSRILGNPAGYQLDSNFHSHLANGTNNTDWMFMCELAMNKKVMDWLSKQEL